MAQLKKLTRRQKVALASFSEKWAEPKSSVSDQDLAEIHQRKLIEVLDEFGVELYRLTDTGRAMLPTTQTERA